VLSYAMLWGVGGGFLSGNGAFAAGFALGVQRWDAAEDI